jgi:hypothetical protein
MFCPEFDRSPRSRSECAGRPPSRSSADLLQIMDPLSATMVTAKGFRSITRRLLKAADELTGGKIVFIQEGAMLRSWVALLTAD